MQQAAETQIKKHFLLPGMTYVDAAECEITTVLGSCVAVCLWDQLYGGGGMNHFMLPLWNGEGLATPKYGNIAMDRLLEHVLQLGIRKERLGAKIFGGANLLTVSSAACPIGVRNIELAMTWLDEWRIPVIASDVGGTVGRKIIMNTQNGQVLLGRGKPQR